MPSATMNRSRRSAVSRIRLFLFSLAIAASALALHGQTPGSGARNSTLVEELERLAELDLGADEPYRIEKISDSIFYVQFASHGDRIAVLELALQDWFAAGAVSPAVVLSDRDIERAYRSSTELRGRGLSFRDALFESNFLPLGLLSQRKILITMIQPTSPDGGLGFELSKNLQAMTERAEGLLRNQGSTPGETRSLMVYGADHPSIRNFEAWRYDGFNDLQEQSSVLEEKYELLRLRRRAYLMVELVDCLFEVDASYETTLIEWMSSGLEPAEINLLARLLQIAGYQDIDPEVLVKKGAPHLYVPSLLIEKLFQRLQGLSIEVGQRGLRRLDPHRFADAKVLENAQAFYGTFFRVDKKDRFSFDLTESTQSFIERQSAIIQRVTDLHLESFRSGSSGSTETKKAPAGSLPYGSLPYGSQ